MTPQPEDPAVWKNGRWIIPEKRKTFLDYCKLVGIFIILSPFLFTMWLLTPRSEHIGDED